MYLTTEKKQEIFEKYGVTATNTGSAEGQIALFSFRNTTCTDRIGWETSFTTRLSQKKTHRSLPRNY